MTIAAPMHAGLVPAAMTVRGLGHHSLRIGLFLDPSPAFIPLIQLFLGLPVVGCVVDIALIAVDSAGRQSLPGQTFSPPQEIQPKEVSPRSSFFLNTQVFLP